jgi:hypothetical protein
LTPSKYSAPSSREEFPAQSIQDGDPARPIESLSSDSEIPRAGMAGRSVDAASWPQWMHIAKPRRSMVLPVWIAAALGGLLLAGRWIGLASTAKHGDSPDPFWRAGVPVPVAVREGRATFRVATLEPASEVLVIVSALARSKGPFPLAVTARPATRSSVPALADDGRAGLPRRGPQCQPDDARAQPPHGLALPPRERAFQMMVRDGDSTCASNYAPIRGVLKGVGRAIQVYVASEDLDQVNPKLVEDIVGTFDEHVFPITAGRFGPAHDVDGDGRFTVLISSWLGHLGGGRYEVDGFVRVADLEAAVCQPFGNRCDMLYLNPALASGPYLRTILAHEYMHAVAYSQKTAHGRSVCKPGLEEEGWLDEALAHLAEDVHGFSTANIDFRVSAFLTSPERYQLVVDDYYAADLFRSHGNRGGTYLFLRWCTDRFGPELLAALVHSDLRGVANLEAATGSTFASLFRRWSLAVYQSGWATDAARPRSAGDGYRSVNMRAPRGEWELAGPRFTRIDADGSSDRWMAVGTSSHFVIVEGSRSGAVEIDVAGPAEAELQVTALPIGGLGARLDLSVTPSRGPGGEISLRAVVRERHGVGVRLSALAWEPLAPGPNPHSGGFHCGRLDQQGIAASFGSCELPGSGELRSRPFRLSGVSSATGQMVVKLIGVDPTGCRVAAWADFSTAPQAED